LSKKIGFIFQTFNLYPTLTALENIQLPMKIHEIPEKEVDDTSKKLLAQVGLSERGSHFPAQLSGRQQQITSVVQTISLFLAAIAAVSLLVGAVGIANTMFMSAMERTRQIGLLKALGATDNEVMKLFLLESGLFGFVGGVPGILFGVLISVVISGVAPARSTSKMNHVDALRFEQ
jgi:putative ABC transport system permease protein